MRFNDTLLGLLILVFGAMVAGYARTFPSMPGQSVGPSLFPTVIGIGFIFLGAALSASGLRRGERQAIAAGAPVPSRRARIGFLLVIVDLVFYAVAVDWLGFFLAGFLFLMVLMRAFGVPTLRAAAVSAGVTLAMHYGFYTLLRVPLPWGLLEPLAW